MKLRVLGVTAGNGVILHPFLKNTEKYELVGNIEPRAIFHSAGQEQWKANFGKIPMRKSLMEIKASGVDLIIGHPDCGSGSVLRLSRAKKTVSYQSNPSLSVFLEAVDKIRPKMFMLENLPAFIKDYPKEKMREMFPKYRFIYIQGSVAIFGNSQVSRKRLVIVGIKKKWYKKAKSFFKKPKLDKFRLKTAEHFEEPWQLNWELCHVREPEDKTCNLILGDRNKITYGEAQGEWQKRANDSRWYVGGKMNNQPGVTRNIAGKYPTTMRKQNRQFRTDGLVLSPREMANIQGVPREFKLYYHGSKSLYWINKARATVTKTPPYEIGSWFEQQLSKFLDYVTDK